MKIITTGLSLLELRAKYPQHFYYQIWYDNELFAKEKPPAGEYEFDLESRHLNETYTEQKKSLQDGFDFPHPAILSEAIIIHFEETGQRLLESWYSRTSNRDSDGRLVYVGNSDGTGLYVSYWDDYRYDNLGLASARKIVKSADYQSKNI